MMYKHAVKQLKISFMLLSILTLLTGVIYPLAVTAIAQLFFPWQANGSLLQDHNQIIGSQLIGQYFNSANYFWGRPSATSPFPYNAANSSGSNMGPSNPDFLTMVNDRVNHLHQSDSNNPQLVPVDLVTASASGLDPEISPLAAYFQINRVAKASHISAEKLRNLIDQLIIKRSFSILGEPRINVLELNLALNKLRSAHDRASTQS